MIKTMLSIRIKVCLAVVGLLLLACNSDNGPSMTVNPTPPFGGTIFLDPDIITASDPSSFVSLTFTGQEERTMFDRRVNDWITNEPFLFDATFDDGLTFEVQVNNEFGTIDVAENEALIYAEVIGKLPTGLRLSVETVWIHKGTELFGGGNNNILIHTGQSALYENDGILEETLVHEASHTSLDAMHAAAPEWIAAQEDDGNFISRYARDYPTREDIAETYLLYMAIRYRSDRIDPTLENTINNVVPHRIKYFDAHPIDMYPIN
jgi:hypothetical protein